MKNCSYMCSEGKTDVFHTRNVKQSQAFRRVVASGSVIVTIAGVNFYEQSFESLQNF